ncbi:hypothetical protein [Rubinisphaera sp. JC750]|uniref:hypothetical protein n=1 Tax=Rubinisphaera sp. JC750 TaxID=2898658 RepID=UPI001F179A2F|nr:hypothetical protein [Rubinisphaera sp. JC750]
MTEQNAYLAMYAFLDALYQSTEDDFLGGLLGSMSLPADGSPADPAIAGEWREAIAKVRDGRIAPFLRLRS